MSMSVSGYVPPECQFLTGEVEHLENGAGVWNADCPPRPPLDAGRARLLENIRRAKAQAVGAGGSHIEMKTVCATAMAQLYGALLQGIAHLRLAAAPLSKICPLLAVSDNSLKVESKTEFLRDSVIRRDLQKWRAEADHAEGNPLKPLIALEILVTYGLSPKDFANFAAVAETAGILGRFRRRLIDPEKIVNANPPPPALWEEMLTDWSCLLTARCAHRPAEIVKL